MADLPPGPRVPGFVNLLGLWTRPASYLERLRARYGPRITLRVPFQGPFVLLTDPEEIKQVFTAAPDVLHPGEGARILEPILGANSVILLDENPHLRQRKLLLPAFHGEKMQRLTSLMTELTEREVAGWPTDEPVALHPRLQRLTLEIILRAVFGLTQGPRLDDLRESLTALLAFSESPLSILPSLQRIAGRFGPFRRFPELIAHVDELIFAQIEERRREQTGRDDVLAMLLHARHDDDSPMSAQEIRDELMTALVAGHETTASQLAWAFERLAHEPAVSARLREELDAGAGEDYLMATIHEVMRLRPVLPNPEPRLVKRPVTIGEVDYPVGVSLMPSVYLVHHDPAIYPEPYAFRPERFLESGQPDDPGAAHSGEAGSRAGGKPGTYTWIPFGGGRRRCLGASFAMQEMKIVLRVVLSALELSPSSSRFEPTGRRSITYSPARGATVLLHARAPRRDTGTGEPEPAAVAA